MSNLATHLCGYGKPGPMSRQLSQGWGCLRLAGCDAPPRQGLRCTTGTAEGFRRLKAYKQLSTRQTALARSAPIYTCRRQRR
jgi:hypothetical protein